MEDGMSQDDPAKPALPSSDPLAPQPPEPASPTPSPLDNLRDTVIDDIGTFTRINIPNVQVPGVGLPDGTKFD
jgi:hypothetical protein